MSTSTSSARGPGREVLDDVATAQQYVLDLQVLFYSLKTVASNAQRAADAAAQGSGAAPCAVDSNSKNARNHQNNPQETSATWQQQVEALSQQLEAERRERARLQEQFDQAASMLRKSYGQIVDDYLFATEQLHERTRQLEGLMGAAAAGQPAPAGPEERLGTLTNPSASVELQGPWCFAESTALHPPPVPSPSGAEDPHDNTWQATALPTSTPPATAYRPPDGGGGESCFANSRNAAAVAAAAGRDGVFLAPRESSGGGPSGLGTAVAGPHQDHMASQGSSGQASRPEQPGLDGDLRQQRWWGSGQASNSEPAEALGAAVAASTARTMASSNAVSKKILAATALPQAVLSQEQGQDRHVAGGLEAPGREAAAAAATSPRARHHSPHGKADRAAPQQVAPPLPLPSHDGGAARRQRDELRQISHNLYSLQQQKKQGARASIRAQQSPKDAAATSVYEDAAPGCRPQATQWTADSPTAAAHQSPAASTFGDDSDVSTPPLRASTSVTSTTSPFSAAAAARNPVSAMASLSAFRPRHDEVQPRDGAFSDAAAFRQPVPDRSPSATARSTAATTTAAAAADTAVPGGALHGEGCRAAARERTVEATISSAVSKQQQQPDARTASASANRNAAAILEAAGRSAQAAARAAAAKAARAAAGLSPQGRGRGLWSGASSQHPEEGRSSGRGEAAGGSQAGVTGGVATDGGLGRTAGDGRPQGRDGAIQGPIDRGAASALSPVAPGRSQSAKRLRRSASSPQERASPRSSTAGVSSRQDRAAAVHGSGAAREQMSGRRAAVRLSARPVPPAEPPSTGVARAASAAEQQVLGNGSALARGRSLRYVQSVSDPEPVPEEAPVAERLLDPLAAAICSAAAAAAPSRLDGVDIKRVEPSSATAPIEVRGAAAASAVAAGRGELRVASGAAKLDGSHVKIDVEAFLHHTHPRSPDVAAPHPAGSTSREHDRTGMPGIQGSSVHSSLGAGFLRTEVPASRTTTLDAAAVRDMATAATGAAMVDDEGRRSARDESPGGSSSSSLEGLASLVRGLRERLAGLQQEYDTGGEANDDDDDEGDDVEAGWQTDDDEELVGGVAAFTSHFGDDDDDVDDDIDHGRNDSGDGNDAYAYDRALSNSYTSSANNGALHYGAEIEDISPLAAGCPGSQKRGKGFGTYHHPYGSAESSASATPRAHSYAASPSGGHEPPRGTHQAGSSAGISVGANGAFSPRAARRGGCDGRPVGPSLLDTVNASTLGHAFGGGSNGSRNASTGSSVAAAAAVAPAASTRGPLPRGPAPADATTAAAWTSSITAAWAAGGSAQHAQHDRVAPPDQTSPRKASLGGLSSRGGKVTPRWKDAEMGVEAELPASGLAGDGGVHVASASAAADKAAGLQGLRSEAMFARIKQQLDDLQNSFAQGLGMGAGRGGAAGGAAAGGGAQGQRAVHGEGEPLRHAGNTVGAGLGGGSGGGHACEAGGRGDGSSGGLWRRSRVDCGPSVAAMGVALGAAEEVGSGAAEQVEVGRREARTVGV